MAGNNPSFVAGGNISVSRFVQFDTTDYQIVQANATPGGKLAGISFEGSLNPPGYLDNVFGVADPLYAGVAGKPLAGRVYGDGEECLLEIGEATGVSQGDWLKPDPNGRGVRANLAGGAGIQQEGAQALESCSASGTKIRVQVRLESPAST